MNEQPSRWGKVALFCLLTALSSLAVGRDFIIFSVVQEVPMGRQEEIQKKNFYINMGAKQGLEKGTTLDVVRSLSRIDPYDNETRHSFDIKIGELKVLHVEENRAVTRKAALSEGKDVPLFEIRDFMVGDQVKVKIN